MRVPRTEKAKAGSIAGICAPADILGVRAGQAGTTPLNERKDCFYKRDFMAPTGLVSTGSVALRL